MPDRLSQLIHYVFCCLILLIPLQLRSQCAPTPIVYNGLVASLPNSGGFTIPASLFDAGSIDECLAGGLFFSYAPDPADANKSFGCSSVGITEPLAIWVTDQSPNAYHNFAKTYIAIQDQNSICPPVSNDCGPVPITYHSLTVDLSAGPTSIPASAFNAGSLDLCNTGSLEFTVGISGNASFNTSISLDCNTVSPLAIMLRVTDGFGNENMVETQILLSDVLDFCGGNSPITLCGPTPVLINELAVALPTTGQMNLEDSALFIESYDGCNEGNLTTTLTEPGGIPDFNLNSLLIDCADVGVKSLEGHIQDNVGNSSYASISIVVQDNVAPRLPAGICNTVGLSVDLVEYGGFKTITGNSLLPILQPTDNCQDDLQVAFSSDRNDTLFVFTCAAVDTTTGTGIINIPISVFDKGTFRVSCQLQFTVNDKLNFCKNYENCTGDQYNLSSLIGPIFFRASDYINAVGTVVDVTYLQAANEINLLPGFKTNPGVMFRAFTQACTPAAQFAERIDIESTSEKLEIRVFPNPINNQSQIEISLAEAAPLQVILQDHTGRLIEELANFAHYDDLYWESSLANMSLPTGVYFLYVQSGTQRQVRKMIRVR